MRISDWSSDVCSSDLLRRLEQGLDQINRLSSNNATLDIQPGDRPGESVVVIHNHPTRRIYANLSADNLGSRSTGRNQMALTGTAEGLLGLNEFISVTRRQSRPLNDGPNRSSRSEEHTSELQSLMRISYAVFCLKKTQKTK